MCNTLVMITYIYDVLSYSCPSLGGRLCITPGPIVSIAI